MRIKKDIVSNSNHINQTALKIQGQNEVTMHIPDATVVRSKELEKQVEQFSYPS